MLFHYSYYLQRGSFYSDHFSEPPVQLSDPTEKGQFSNVAGKAIADFLSKRINQSLYTVNYEAEMRLRGMHIGRVSRPDLIAYNQTSKFALEAKGHSSGCGDMTKHKNQSRRGGIPVNFSVACISYNLFKRVKCNYHDPYNDSVPYDNDSLSRLTKEYYRGLSGFLNEKYFSFREVSYQNERFFEVDLFYPGFDKMSYEEPPFFPMLYHELLHYYHPRLILPIDIQKLAETGISNHTSPFLFDIGSDSDTSVYIDNDRVGLRIR
jgi:hypothetical protein